MTDHELRSGGDRRVKVKRIPVFKPFTIGPVTFYDSRHPNMKPEMKAAIGSTLYAFVSQAPASMRCDLEANGNMPGAGTDSDLSAEEHRGDYWPVNFGAFDSSRKIRAALQIYAIRALKFETGIIKVSCRMYPVMLGYTVGKDDAKYSKRSIEIFQAMSEDTFTLMDETVFDILRIAIPVPPLGDLDNPLLKRANNTVSWLAEVKEAEGEDSKHRYGDTEYALKTGWREISFEAKRKEIILSGSFTERRSGADRRSTAS